ncbi:hypothetical protein [Lentimicrobium sp. S6]|uniref:hypothetical protein n=1 Tax=Lentimicrobium sp. S6 TaxID=2735872 RepID=UPI001555E66C|nr:hypothetical protein [Lentimicrobium sp. S6]NPD46812.1 hypothetical protein [Lentimicrobium sp. S6]
MNFSLNKNCHTCLLIIFLMISENSYNQELLKNGRLAEISYQFNAPEHNKEKTRLTHALSYAYSKDISDIKSSITYQVNYKVLKNQGKGFETIISFRPPIIQGHTKLYDFDFRKEILPLLSSLKIFYSNGSELIYVKPISDIDTISSSLYFHFKHQRYSDDWELSLEQVHWKFLYNEKEFVHRWSLVNDYQMACEWVSKIENLEEANDETQQYIEKTRWLQVLKEMKQLEFYQELIITHHSDPQNLQEKISIRQFILERELEDLKLKLPQEFSDSDLESLSQAYIQVERDLLRFSSESTNLYGDLYFEFEIKNTSHFCKKEMKELLFQLNIQNEWENFEYGIQKNSLALIKELMADKRANEALFQIDRFNYFYKNADYLGSSSTFNHFKAKAVYDIYLSYIQVSKQAIEHQRIDMAIGYLNKASDIQKQYPIEIINDLQVENELQKLIKSALDRYQHLLKTGNFKTAERVKEGIIGLMKKLGIDHEELLLEDG